MNVEKAEEAEISDLETQPGARPDTAPPADSHPSEPLLHEALSRVMRAIMFGEQRTPALDALPMGQLRLLWAIRRDPDATMKDYSERLNVSQSTATQLAESLVRRGLIQRRTGSKDRRVVRLQLSESGAQIVEQSYAQRRQMAETVWDACSEEERQEVMRALELLARTAETVREAQELLHPAGPEPAPQDRSETPSGPQPMVDLMARRVRGRINS